LYLESKILNGLERLSEALKSLLWEKAKIYGISPIQIQILLFVSDHRLDICNVSSLAREFNLTKATISDAVKVLLKKRLLEKDFSPTDNRRYNLFLTTEGNELVKDLAAYSTPISEELAKLEEQELIGVYQTITKLIFQLHQRGIIQVQRTCFKCRYYSGDKENQHFCNFLNKKLERQEIRLDCKEFEEEVGSR